MKHYPHHIGDFDKATRHCTRIERSVYRDLLDLYYDTESQLTLDQAELCRKIIARTDDESTAVERMLNEFFTKTPTGWYHDRCEDEISKYHANTSQKAQAGKASAAAKAQKKQQALNGCPTDVERANNGASTNHKPINQSTNQPKKSACVAAHEFSKPDSVTETVWQDFLKHRKTKKSVVTDNVIKDIEREATKAGWTLEDALRECCSRGWTGFKSGWVAANGGQQSGGGLLPGAI